MNRWAALILLIFPIVLVGKAPLRFGETLCQDQHYFCFKIRSGDSWMRLFPDEEARNIVQRVNRMNITLRRGMTIAIPKNLDTLTVFDVSPFPKNIQASGEKIIYVNQKQLAFGAYNEDGRLLWWGPISSGIGICPGIYGGCKTPSGDFRIIRKQSEDCVSTAFPKRIDGDNGGAEMPYCMHFFRGYALHGSHEVPGYRSSHGCVRLFTEDARWLNEDFITTPEEGFKGTRVIIDDRL